MESPESEVEVKKKRGTRGYFKQEEEGRGILPPIYSTRWD